MTTRLDAGTTPRKPPRRWLSTMWFVPAAAALVFGAPSVLTALTLASDEMHWFTAFWAAVGTLGFSGTSVTLTHQHVERPTGRRTPA